jgi:uncharacterized protein
MLATTTSNNRMNEPSLIKKILADCKTIAVVGLTNREGRASLGISHRSR